MKVAPEPEFTVICVDNGRKAYLSKSLIKAQIEAIKLYCKTVFECSSENIVTILTMSSLDYGKLVGPTNDLQQILCALEDESMYEDASILLSKYHYARTELKTLANAVYDDDSHVVDIVCDYESSVLDTLSNTILQKHVCYIEEQKVELSCNEKESKPESCEIEKNRSVEAPQIQFVKPGLEQFHNEKTKSAANEDYGQASGIEQGNRPSFRVPKSILLWASLLETDPDFIPEGLY